MIRSVIIFLSLLLVSFAQNSWQMGQVYKKGIELKENSVDTRNFSHLSSFGVKRGTNEIRCSTAEEIQNAMKTAQPGDSIVIEPGTYIGSTSNSGNSRAHFYGYNNGTAENPIYLTAASLDTKPVLKGASIGDKYLLYITGDHWYVKGLVLREAKKGIMLDNSNYTQIFNTEIDTIGEEGIHIRDGSSYNLISNCTITETGLYTADFGEGVYFGSDVGKWGDFTKNTIFRPKN